MKSGRTPGPPGNIFSRFVDVDVHIGRLSAFLAASRPRMPRMNIFPRRREPRGNLAPSVSPSRMNFAYLLVVPWLVNFSAIPSYLVSFRTVPSTNRLLVFRPSEQRNTNTKMSGRRFQSELCRRILLYVYILLCNERCTWLVGAFMFVS